MQNTKQKHFIYKLITIGVLSLACFVPVGIISYNNRPVAMFYRSERTHQTIEIVPEKETQSPIITLKPIKIVVTKQHKTIPQKESPLVCKERELLSGGTIRYCDRN